MRIAWVRQGRRKWAVRSPDVAASVPPRLASQIVAMLGLLGDTAGSFGVPVTLVLLANRQQLFGQAGFALQDFLIQIAASKNMDVFDARGAFHNRSNKRYLFLPDWHHTSAANQDIINALLTHLVRKGVRNRIHSGLPCELRQQLVQIFSAGFLSSLAVRRRSERLRVAVMLAGSLSSTRITAGGRSSSFWVIASSIGGVGLLLSRVRRRHWC